ncbi:MAG TPA: CBS domain-containing protein [Candidatus Bathyarchaeia archaeon]|nr:CBS domain-containing protein [Candidatus Bathyarchaeia archaeon]
MATVKEFMTRDPANLALASKVSDAVKIMAEKNIGSIIVVANGKPKGILTERDILDKVVNAEKNPETTRVADVMSTSIAVVDSDAPLKEAAKTMTSEKARLVVLEKGKPVGIVTATDIVREIHLERSAFDPSTTISRRIITVPTDTSVRDVVGIMSKRRVGSVIVTRNGKPCGIFTERDLVKRVLSPRKSLDTPIDDVATRKLIIARAGTDGKGAASIMASSHIKRLLLLKGDEMAGIITARDLVEAYAVS